MNVHQFIQDRNSQMKAQYEILRSDKSMNRDKRLEKIATDFQVSTSTVHDAIYRSKPTSKKPKA